MAAFSLRKWLGKIPFKSRLFPGLDERRLQHEIDVHKLFLLTSYHRLGTPISSNAIQEIERLSLKLPFEEQLEKVQENVHLQVMDIARTIHRAIVAVHRANDGSTDGMLENARNRGPVQNGGRTDNFSPNESRNEKERGGKRRTGLALAVGGDIDTGAIWNGRQARGSISMDASGAILRENHGFSLFTAKSEIKHPDAGVGLFIRGRAKPGAVVAFFPGIAYTPSRYRLIEGYPDVVEGNPYLIGRYDGVIVDAKPWGQGGKGRQRWSAVAGGGFAWQEEAEAGGHGRNEAAAGAASSPLPLDVVHRGHALAVVDRGHPLALGHYVNHPPSGISPNVMALGYDFVMKRDGEEKMLRQFIPNINCEDEVEKNDSTERGVGQKGGNDSKVPKARNRAKGVQHVRSVIFVALREVEDEELLRNYRLNPNLERPEWYCPVDEEEERRRWSE